MNFLFFPELSDKFNMRLRAVQEPVIPSTAIKTDVLFTFHMAWTLQQNTTPVTSAPNARDAVNRNLHPPEYSAESSHERRSKQHLNPSRRAFIIQRKWPSTISVLTGKNRYVITNPILGRYCHRAPFIQFELSARPIKQLRKSIKIWAIQRAGVCFLRWSLRWGK